MKTTCHAMGPRPAALQNKGGRDGLHGIGSGVAEIKISAPGGDTYRVVYVAKFNEAVYVLDAFQKKSPSGSRLPKNVQNRIQRRYDDLTVARKRQGLQ
ncbi:MAG: hypothetical protein BRD38_03255 [Bacteroidetes bacterium QH_9_67_14]|nr:MAG: hypothetical protein BRD38_03255 [Bacteroidetes bacterium QH_9_67_14]